MRSNILLKTSLHALKQHKVRSFLTILGIMIGVGSIIVTFSIGRGAEERIRAEMLAMGENAIYVLPFNISTRGATRGHPLKKRDLEAIAAQCENIKAISRTRSTRQSIEYKKKSIQERIIGTDENSLEISKYAMKAGIFFSKHHVQNRVNVAVLGHKTAELLFGEEIPLGKIIKINKIPFTVVGVLEHIEFYWGPYDSNLRIYIPFTVGKKYFPSKDESPDDVGELALTPLEPKDAPALVQKISRILRFTHNLKEDDPDDFTIIDQQAIAQARAAGGAGVIKLFGLIAASIALLVGGIGIMNIMLVSVQERTREIGIRIALGATQRTVQLQFLFEAIALCSIGGIIGISLGMATLFALNYFFGLPGIVEFFPLMAAFFATVFIGIFFGFYPARKASRLNPVDALLER